MAGEDIAVIREVLDNPLTRIEMLLTVVDKRQQTVPFKLNAVQRDYCERRIAGEKNPSDIRGMRRITVKARQMGMSVAIVAYNASEAMLKPNTNVLIMCQDDDTLSRFRNLVHQCYNDLARFELAPKMTTDNEHEIAFDEINSHIVLRTATDKAGRADTFSLVHMSEFALYEDAGAVLAAVIPSVPPWGQIDIESTSQGPAGPFYEFANRAHKGEGEWTMLFYPWWWESSYIADPALYLTTDYTPEEIVLRDEHGLTDPQIAFRRFNQAQWELLGPEAPPIEREFAETFEGAFSPGNNAVFTSAEMLAIKARTREPVLRKNGIWVWRRPVPGEGYVVGGDTGAGGAKSDYSSAFVVDKNGFQCAGFYEKVDAVAHAGVLNEIGQMFNNAYMVPEGWPGEGAVTAKWLQESYKYHNLHYSTVAGMLRPGFSTTPQTRPDLVNSLYRAVRYQQLWINDSRCYEELRTLVWHTRKPRPGAQYKLQASEGAHDDYTFAAALANQHKEMAVPRRAAGEAGNGAGFSVGF